MRQETKFLKKTWFLKSSICSRAEYTISPSKAKLLKKQDGKCPVCGGRFKTENLVETHHIKAKMDGGNRE
ncbi:HNH endonuclease signature motif containing protein [Candidatus Marithioploca araucensis]|uniref:HNH endonuclease signature motif containing protein n=1 Tax=Candidatus Marithioploca araucensis TaxID=70273 RepID=A0ABT7VS73_9GAMM|nr:HNH endonuclease signature motif containing protein [Candidatus Marithioploca araucensis]